MNELLEHEKLFLANHHYLDKYKKMFDENNNTKNDILWHIYNEIKDSYFTKRDYFSCFLVYQQMSKHLYSEKKYEQALHFFIVALYVRIYDVSQECIDSGVDSDVMYERHISKFHKQLAKYMKKANCLIDNTNDMCTYVKKLVNHFVPNLSDDFWVYWLSFKYVDYISHLVKDE